MSAITTHVLDLARGRPAAGLAVRLERQAGDGSWRLLGVGLTGEDGRIREWPGPPGPARGIHRLTFATGPYFEAGGTAAFYPEVSVVFDIADAAEHHHVPLLLSPFGYSPYRGS